jgi:hypothetical protein
MREIRDYQADGEDFHKGEGYVVRRVGVHLLALFCLLFRLVYFAATSLLAHFL